MDDFALENAKFQVFEEVRQKHFVVKSSLLGVAAYNSIHIGYRWIAKQDLKGLQWASVGPTPVFLGAQFVRGLIFYEAELL